MAPPTRYKGPPWSRFDRLEVATLPGRSGILAPQETELHKRDKADDGD